MTEAARKAWRELLAPLLDRRQLEFLRDGLARDDARLFTGGTVEPNPDDSPGAPVEKLCPVAYGLSACGGMDTAGEAEWAFNAALLPILKGPDGASYGEFFRWVDDSPWQEVRPELLAEVELALQ